jgi:hypothetical protein
VVFYCNGNQVSATLDGMALDLDAQGTPRSGHLQFRGIGGTFRATAIEFRPQSPLAK